MKSNKKSENLQIIQSQARLQSPRTNLIETCKIKLLTHKSYLLSQLHTLQSEFNNIDKARGDESDLSFAHQEEHQFLITQSRIKKQLFEIENALARIENDSYGYCEITGEKIEESRLLALPWTRYSIEGAEIFESQNQKRSI